MNGDGKIITNNVTKEIYKAAHQTSARYPLLINEAEVNGLKTTST